MVLMAVSGVDVSEWCLWWWVMLMQVVGGVNGGWW